MKTNHIFSMTIAALLTILVVKMCGEDVSLVRVHFIESVEPSVSVFAEGDESEIIFTAIYRGEPEAVEWKQVGGPIVPLAQLDSNHAKIDVSGVKVAADTELQFVLIASTLTGLDVAQFGVIALPQAMEPLMGENVHIGGATTSVAYLEKDAAEWILYNVGNRLTVRSLDVAQTDLHVLHLPGYINDIEVTSLMGTPYAVLAMGSKGLAVVSLADPTAPQLVNTVHVNFYKEGISFAEGGGDIIADSIISGTRGDITCVAANGTDLWIGDASFGIHRTALTNILTPTPALEGDGTLLIDQEVFTLQYAGEVPWGGPTDLKLVGSKLFAALDFLGLAIYDPNTLEQVGRYNLYTDTSVSEDWFIDMDVATKVQPGFLDASTGMPDYRQASFEILQVWKAGVNAPTPWADFERYGKYYYHARALDVTTYDEGDPNEKTIAYIAYGLAGLVAVDVTGFGGADSGGNFLTGTYLGYAPAVPVHGPEEGTGGDTKSLFPHFGAGKLKESGAVSVAVIGSRVYYGDHFGGLVVLDGADNPGADWKMSGAPFDNDNPALGNGVLGDHVPNFEFVTSYDMSPYDPADHESLPVWMYQEPSLLTSGELSGHGNAVLILPGFNDAVAGGTDLLLASAAGGLNYIDIVDLGAPVLTDRFTVSLYLPTTDEVGAAPDGTPTQTVSIGHSDGISASDNFLYLADGPHGMLIWQTSSLEGIPSDNPRLVANVLQDEYPVVLGEETVYPTPHAHGVMYDRLSMNAFVMGQSAGLRRVNVLDVEIGKGTPGSPIILKPQLSDFFEHNSEAGTTGIQGQDHAYGADLKGDLAFVADGSNGLTVYDLSKDPSVLDSGFFVSNLGNTTGKPPLGRSTGVALWEDTLRRKTYAFVAAGPRGVGVVDVTNPADLILIKVFEPIKMEDDKVGKADGRCVDVEIVGKHAFFTYDSFGIVAYAISDLIKPLPPGISPNAIWELGSDGAVTYDYRPVAVGYFKLQTIPGYEEYSGGALKFTHTNLGDRMVFYVAYGTAGIVRIDWSEITTPVLEEHVPTVGECAEVAITRGRLFAADGTGGIVGFK